MTSMHETSPVPTPAGWSRRVTLACPVEGCRRPLLREGGGLRCARAHTFDLARSGYVNLLQPRDRRSARPGDAPAALAARSRLLARGVETAVTEAVRALVAVDSDGAVLDVGCGAGDFVAALADRSGVEGHGLDLAVRAIDAAARRHPALHWVVANADRALPYADGSFSLLTSINARRNPAEFRRVLRDGGVLLLVVPAPDDLVELRERVLGEGIARDRVPAAIAEFEPRVARARHERIRHTPPPDAAAARDAMAGSYRAGRASRRGRLEALPDLEVTLSRDALVLRARDRAGGDAVASRRRPR
jgi:23S rRNA (guanine745-N1)-methyltransferase